MQTNQTAQEANTEKKLTEGLSCSKCGHVKICAPFRAIAPLLAGWEENVRPFQAENLAKICKEFIQQSVLAALNTTEG